MTAISMTTQFGRSGIHRLFHGPWINGAVSRCFVPTVVTAKRLIVVVTILAWFFVNSHGAVAEEFLSEFDGPEISWKVFLNPQESRVSLHQRRRGAGKFGGAEFVRINSSRENSRVRLEHPVPPATVIDELELSLWVKSNHDGFELKARITLPMRFWTHGSRNKIAAR